MLLPVLQSVLRGIAIILFCALLSGVVAVGPSTGIAQKTEQSKAANQPKSDSTPDHPSGPAIQPKENQQGAAKEPECAKKDKTDYADCLIQLRTARATEVQAYWGKISAHASVGALVFAAIAAAAALWTVITMRDTAKRQLRAYVFGRPENVDLNGRRVERIHIQVRNHGQTPANNVSIRGAVNIYPYPLPEGFDLGDVGEGETTQSIGPLTDIPAPLSVGRAPNAQDTARLRAGTHRVYVFVVIRYKNVFGKLCTTKVCASTDGPLFMEMIERSAAGGGQTGLNLRWDYSPQHNEND